MEEQNNFLLYKNHEGDITVDVFIQNETIWLTINQMAELFGVDKSGISRHIKNIFETGELSLKEVVAKIATTTQHGAIANKTQTKEVNFYNLDMIISVGYRVNSVRGTHFRIWATQQLKELIIKGFVIDNQKLKEPNNPFGKDYFDELLEQIRDIRSSEKRFYQKITDIYALAVDYSSSAEETKKFFKIVQNKLLFAATGNTAAEIITNRVNDSNDNLGLTTFSGTKVRKKDVTVAKNYLQKEELDTLNRIVTMYLDYAELQAKQHKQMFTKDWQKKLDAFLQFNSQEVLTNAGTVQKKVADALAIKKYEAFNSDRLKLENQQPNDFDKAIKKLKV